MLKRPLALAAILYSMSIYAGVDFIIFSYDRPMQLFALLESTEQYITGIDSISVIYRTSSEQFDVGYEKCFSYFQDRLPLILRKQGSNPSIDFKPLVIQSMTETTSDYVMFGVDDNIIKDRIDIAEATSLLEKTGSYGFYLRLGMNTNYSYGCKNKVPFPHFDKITQNVYVWKISSAKGDWGYPNTVDMTIYHKKDIELAVKNLSYANPNTFESDWAGCVDKGWKGLCFEQSKILNIPLNRVQSVYENLSMNLYTTNELLKKFLADFRIDISVYHNIDNKSPHWPYFPSNVLYNIFHD